MLSSAAAAALGVEAGSASASGASAAAAAHPLVEEKETNSAFDSDSDFELMELQDNLKHLSLRKKVSYRFALNELCISTKCDVAFM